MTQAEKNEKVLAIKAKIRGVKDDIRGIDKEDKKFTVGKASLTKLHAELDAVRAEEVADEKAA